MGREKGYQDSIDARRDQERKLKLLAIAKVVFRVFSRTQREDERFASSSMKIQPPLKTVNDCSLFKNSAINKMCKQVAQHSVVGEEFNDTRAALRVGELGNAKEDASRASTFKIRRVSFVFFLYICK